MKFALYSIFSLAISSKLLALPEGEQVVAGKADFQATNIHTLQVTTSDKAIINYQKFNIGEKEHVQFIQPSSKSCVLNRIKGENPSQILGKLSANGRVFLVNPQGIYFGPNASVNTGSFLASTLNIRDEDFLNEKFHFFLEPGSEKAKIINEGAIAASPEGFVAFFAPIIQNRGSILARAEKVVLAAAERVTLDFSGDGLIQFTVDGDLKQALIENYGKIETARGSVEVSLRTARDAIKMVVNTDGVTYANDIEEVGGIIRLVNTGSIVANKVILDGKDNSRVDVEGVINASSSEIGEKGGVVHILGDHVALKSARIDVSGDSGGGEVLIGGGYLGKEAVHNAQTTTVDSHSTIYCDAYRNGDAGRVIVWSDDTTLYEGRTFARGGSEGGNGGLVETSGLKNLGIQKGYVNALAPLGKVGNWFLDPDTITIDGAGGGTLAQAANCGSNNAININVATINAAGANVLLCARSSIVQNAGINVNIAAAGVGITYQASSSGPSSLTTTLGGNITTNGGAITFNSQGGGKTNTVLINAATVTMSSGGGAISFSDTINSTGGARNLVLNAGAGSLTVTGAIGNTSPLSSLTITNAAATTFSSAVTVTGALTQTNAATGATTFGSTVAVGSATLRGTTFALNNSFSSTGAVAVTNSGTLTKNSTGSITAPGGFSTTGNVNLASNITTTNTALSIGGSLTLAEGSSPVLTSGTGTLTITGATDGTAGGVAESLTLSAAGGIINLGAVGGTNALSNLSFTSASLIQIGNNIAVTGANPLTFPSPVSLAGPSTITSNNASITFNSTLNGAQGLTLVGGTGSVTLTGIVGGTAPLTNLAFTSANLIQIGNNITVTGANPLTFPSPVSLTGNSIITSNNANISFNSTLNGAHDLTLAAGTGTVTLSGAVGAITPLVNFSITAATINLNSTIQTSGAFTVSGSTAINIGSNITTSGGAITMGAPVTVSNNPIFDTTNGGATTIGANISFLNTLNGATTVTALGGTAGVVSFTGAVGGGTPLTSLSASGFTVTQSSTAQTTGALTYTGSTAVNVGGNITTSGGIITMAGPVTLSNNPIFDTTNAGGVAAGANINFSSLINGATSLTLRAGTGGNVFFGGVIGGVTPLTNLAFTSANSIQVSNNITVTGANPLIFSSPVTMTGNSNITSNNGNITFSSTVNGDVALTRTLRLIAGSGNATFTGAVGGTTTLDTLAISSANNVTASAITVGALSQSAGSGTTTFNGAISTSNILGVNLTGTAFTFNSSATTTGSGGITIANSELLSIPNGSNLSVSGAFSQTGSGAVRSGNTITANGISFNGAVALTDAASYSTAATPQLITFASSIDSLSTTPFNLTLDAGTSNITISGNVGSIHPLGAFLVSQTHNLTMQGIAANSATLNGGTGTTTINGNTVIGSGGISLTGNNFVNNGDVIVTGSVTINNSGTATRAPGHTTVVGGNYSVIGTGPAFAGSSLTVGGNILINPAVTLVSNAILDTSGGGGNITLSSTVNGAHDLNLLLGTGSLTFGGIVGGAVPIGALTISSANNVTAPAIHATSITQTAGTGTTTFNGALTTSGASGISINTNNIIRGAAITTTGGGPLTITNSGSFTSTAAGAITLDGAFTQNGSGTVSFGGTITTNNAAISFASPISLAAATSYHTGTGGGNITLSQAVQGAFSLTLNSGVGNISLGGNIGTLVTPLTGFTITRAADVSTQAIFSSFITQTVGTGTTTFQGTLNTSTVSGISLAGTNFTFNNTFTTTASGPLNVTHTGLLTFNAPATGSIAGAFTQSGIGTTQLSSAVTAGGSMQFSGPFTAVGSGSLSTQVAGQPITFFSTVDGPGNLTLSSGAADITLSADAGATTPLGNLTISTVDDFTTQAITASSITQSAGSGTTLFNGALTTSGSGGIQLAGSIFTLLDNVTAGGTGTIVINNAGTLTTTTGKTISGNDGFSQTGAGSVSLASNVSASNNNISFASPITLTSSVVLNSGTTAGDITLSTVDGGFDLTFIAGRDIFAGVIGGTTRLGVVEATTVRNNHASSITAASIIQLAGTGTTTLNGNINTNTPAGINLVGTNFVRSGSIITTNGGSFSVSNSGTITGTSINTTSIDGTYTQIAVGPSSTLNLAGTISARLGISLSSPITLISDPMNVTPIILDSSAGSGNIVVTSTINNNAQAPHTFIVRSGGGNVTLSGAIGGTAPIGPLKLGNVNDFTANAISADSIQQEAMTTFTGVATFNGAITTTGTTGVTLDGNALTLNNNVTSTGNGVVALTNSGLLTIANSTLFNLDGSFTQSGAGNVSFGGSITTTNDAISFASPVTLTNAAALNTGAGAGNITLSSTLNGASTLDLTAGTGNVSLQGVIGQVTPPTSLVIHSANTVLVGANATLSGPFTLVSATGATTFNGTLTASAVNLTGAAMNLNQAVTTTSGAISINNSGTLTVASMSPITSATTLTQSGAGSVSLGSNITTSGTLSIASPITLTNNVVFNSGGGNQTISNTVAGAFNMTLTAGAGDITLSGNIGSPRLENFTITSADDISAQAITAAAINFSNFTGTATLNGSLDTNTMTGITLAGNNLTMIGSITTTNGGPLTITNSGLMAASGAGAISLGGGGAFTQNGSGAVQLGGSVTTQNGAISLSSPTTILSPTLLSSNNGPITFSNTVDGPDCLTLTAAAGNVTLTGVVGGTTPLGCLNASGNNIFQDSSLTTTGTVQESGTTAISVGGDITTTGSNITLTGDVTVTDSITLTTTGGAGNISVTGTINGDVAGYDLSIQTGSGNITLGGTTGENVPFNDFTLIGNNITWNDHGSSVFGATGLTTVTATTDIIFAGTSYKNGTQIYTAGGNFNFTAGALTTVTANVLPITFVTGTLQLGATDLSVISHGGNVTLTSLSGTGRDLIVDADTGSFTFTQIGSLGNNLNNVTLTANTFSPTPVINTNVFANSLVINSSTPQVISTNQTVGTITYNAPVVIQGNISYTCGAAGTITFNRRVDANTANVDTLSFDFNPCTGSIIFNAPVGGVAPLASLSINAPVNVTVDSTMTVGSFALSNGTGTVNINPGLTSTSAAGVTIDSPVINLTGGFSTANGGAMVLDNSENLTVTTGSSFDISGAFQQIGAGNVSFGGTVMTHDNLIQFTAPVTLIGTTSFSSEDMSGGSISFESTIQGAYSLDLTAGSGDISFSGAIGSITPLIALDINSASTVTASAAIFAQEITQSSGLIATSLQNLTTTSTNGIHLTGAAFNLNGNITTTGNGPLVITNAGLLTFGNNTYSIAGALTQNGSGASAIAGAFTAGGAVSFTQNATLTNTASFNTSANSQNISFGGLLTNDNLGPHNLSFILGSGDLLLSGAVGATPVGVFTITSAHNVTTGAISATSITQNAGSGLTSITGNLTTSGASGIQLTGTQFNINSTVVTTGGGPLAITNTGPLSLTLGNSTLIGGGFTQLGGGAVSLSGTIATSNQPISFANNILLTGSSQLSTGAAAAAITLSGSVNGTQPLTLTAAGGDIIFGSSLGATTPLGALTITSFKNITYPATHAASIVQQASSGTTTITGPLNTTGSLGISITGGAITQNGSMTTSNSGGVSFINTGLLTISANTTTDGAYSQSGGGSVNLGGSITATNNTISFTDPVALTADVALISGPIMINSNAITFSSNVTGAQDLELTAIGGSIVFSGNIGTLVTPLTALTIQNADSVSIQNVFADAITQVVGTGLTTFNGTVNSSTIALTGTAFDFNNSVTSSGALTLTNSGLTTFNAGATTTLSGALTQNGSGELRLSSAITAGGAMTFMGPFSVSGSGSLSTQAANQPITFLHTVSGPGNLTLSSGLQDISFQMNAGYITRLGALTISSARNITAQGIKASSFTQSTGSNLTLFNGDLDTNGAGGINLTGTHFTFTQNVITTGNGPITLTNTGTLTTTIGKSFSSNNTFTQNGSGSVLIASAITTTNSNAANAGINFSGTSPVTLIAPSTFNSGTGGGTINFSATNTVDGTYPLTLTAGSGDINILSNFGGTTRIGAFTITSVHDVQLQSLRANSITQLAGSGTSEILGNMDTNTPAGILLIGNDFLTGLSPPTITTTNSGSLTITNQGIISGGSTAVITLDGAFIQNGPGPFFLGSVTARQGISCTGPAILVDPITTLNSSAGAGDIVFNNILSGIAGTEPLIVNAGLGNVTFAQPIGLTTSIGPIPVTSLGSLTAIGEAITIHDIGDSISPGITNTTTLTASDEILFIGTTYNAHTQNYTVTTTFHMDGGALTTFTSNGSVMTFQGGGIELSTSTDLTMNSGGSALSLGTIHAQASDHRHLILNTGAANLQVAGLGASNNGEFASASFTSTNLTLSNSYADSFALNYTATLNTTGNIVSTDTALFFLNPVVLQGTSLFSTVGTTGAGITFSSTLNGAVNDAFGLTLSAGAGNINFSSNVGTTRRLSNLTIDSAANVTLAPATPMVVDALVQVSGSGTTTFNGPITVPGGIGILLTGNNFSFNSTVTTLNNAPLNVANSGTLTFAGTANLSGAFTQSTPTGPVTLSGSITAGQPISFAGPVTLSATPSLSTSAANQSITFSNTLSGSGSLTMAAGSGGNIFLQAAAGTNLSPIGTMTVNSCHDISAQNLFAASVQLLASSGTATFNGTINTTTVSGIHLIGTHFDLDGALLTTGGGSVLITNTGLVQHTASTPSSISVSYTQNGTGHVHFGTALTTNNGPISFASPFSLIANSTLNSSPANQNIAFADRVEGPNALSANAGAGDISFAQTIGDNQGLSNLTAIAHTINIFNVGSIGSGVIGTMSLSASHDITCSGTDYNAQSHNYSAGNTIHFTAGTQTDVISFGGPVTFTGGAITLSSGNDFQVLTNNGNFSFASILGTNAEKIVVNTATGDANLNTISSLGSITDLAVSGGNITFAGAITATSISMTSATTISNAGPQVLIQTPNNISLNALTNNIGSSSNPILVHTSGLIFAGAGGSVEMLSSSPAFMMAAENSFTVRSFIGGLANFDGISSDNTVHEIPSNPPCIIIFNGVTIKHCTIPPTPPAPPSPPPSVLIIPFLPFAVPGFDSSLFNLASDYFFLPSFLDDTYIRKEAPMYWSRGSHLKQMTH